jgi:hypothetical protein
VTLRPPIKSRIPPINGSTPVALYQWNLLERQKPGIPLIKGIATISASRLSRKVRGRDKGVFEANKSRYGSPSVTRELGGKLFLLEHYWPRVPSTIALLRIEPGVSPCRACRREVDLNVCVEPDWRHRTG